MKRPYKTTWKYLEGELSTVEEEQLMKWIDQSDRNEVFFDQVVNDFNEINTLSQPLQPANSWYWVAAVIPLLIVFSMATYFYLNPVNKSNDIIVLPDGSKITLESGTAFEYDSITFEATKWIKIGGTAELSTQPKEHLLVETNNGFLMMGGDSKIQIRDLQNRDINVVIMAGTTRWLNPKITGEELSLTMGEKLLFKSDGKTVVQQSDATRTNSFFILENYMNL